MQTNSTKSKRLGLALHNAIFKNELPKGKRDRAMIKKFLVQLIRDGAIIDFKHTGYVVRPVYTLTEVDKLRATELLRTFITQSYEDKIYWYHY